MTPANLASDVTINSTDHPYQRVAFEAPRLSDAMRAGAAWLDAAERAIDEVPFVAFTTHDVDDDHIWQFCIYVYLDEFQAATKPTRADS